MRKFYTPILIVQFVLMIMFLMYALVQRTQAIKQRELAEVMRQEALTQKMLAEQNEMKAFEAQHEAMQQADLARQALDACEKKKK